jgi:hypothetical protein
MSSTAWAEDKALVAITLDLEMSRNFPTWDQVHWDYHKGELDAATKRYATEAGRRVAARGGVIHYFAVGQVFEQGDVNWLKALAADGHPIGNHTYDHVNVLAKTPDELQYRFRRWPWLVRGRTPREVIVDQVRMTNEAIGERLGVAASGFRTPGGFSSGLGDRPDVQELLRDEGFDWVSSQYAGVPELAQGTKPSRSVFDAIVASQSASQPFQYPGGLVEVPMSPISDIHCFRTARWGLGDFLHAIERAVDWAIRNRAVFDFLAHPSCLLATDPHFEAIDLIVNTVEAAGDRAALVDLQAIARRVQGRHVRRPE